MQQSHLKYRKLAVVLGTLQIVDFHMLVQRQRRPCTIRRRNQVRDRCGELLRGCQLLCLATGYQGAAPPLTGHAARNLKQATRQDVSQNPTTCSSL